MNEELLAQIKAKLELEQAKEDGEELDVILENIKSSEQSIKEAIANIPTVDIPEQKETDLSPVLTELNALKEEVKKKSIQSISLSPELKKELKGDKGDTVYVDKIIEKTEVIREIPIVTENVVEKITEEVSGETIVERINTGSSVIKKDKVEGLVDLEKKVRANLEVPKGIWQGTSEVRVKELITADRLSHPSTDTDEKVKLSASDPTAGYLDDKLQEGIQAVQYDSTPTLPTLATGLTYYDVDNHTLSTTLENGVNLQHGQEIHIYGKNVSGGIIYNGTPVAVVQNNGSFTAFTTVDITTPTAYAFVGLATHDIAVNGFGYVTTQGKVRDINTSAYDEGKPVYVSPSGGLTKTFPTVPNYIINVGICEYKHAQHGIINVISAIVPRLQDLSDVDGTPLTTDGQIPIWHDTEGYFDFDKNINDYKSYSGFENRTDSTISINESGVFTLAPTSTSFNVYTNGSGKHIISTTQTVSVTDDQTITYIYIDTNGVLQKSTAAWDLSSGVNAPCAIVFKDGTNYALTDERHSYERNKNWHRWAHFNIGAMYKSGLTGTFGNNSTSVTQGVIYDEDLEHDTGGTKTSTSLWYRNATSGMRLIRNNAGAKGVVGGALAYDNGSGTLQAVTNNRYVTNWVYATGDATEPIYTVIGQNNDTTLAAARNASAPTINLSTAEWKLIYRVIFQRTTGLPTGLFVEAADFRTVQTGVATSATTTDHASLINRDAANSHPATAISNEPSGSVSATTVQSAINELDTEKVPYTGATGDVDLNGRYIKNVYLYDNAATPKKSIDPNVRGLYNNSGEIIVDYSVKNGIALVGGYPLENNITVGKGAGNLSSLGGTYAALFFGSDSGFGANGAENSNYFGTRAGIGASNSSYSNFFGNQSGSAASTCYYSNFFGYSAGSYASSSYSSNFFGTSSGFGTSSPNSNFFGNEAGYSATNTPNSNYFGNQSGYAATEASYSNFFGNQTGYQAVYAKQSNFFGDQSGYGASSAFDSIFIGTKSGYNDTVNNREKGNIATYSINSAGTGYNVSDVLTISGGDANATITVNSVVNGSVGACSINTPGSGYINGTAGISSGNGDCYILVTVDADYSSITGWSILDGGTGYYEYEYLTIDGGDYYATIMVTSVDGNGTITGANLISNGITYYVGQFYTYGGSGSGCIIDITSVGAGIPISVSVDPYYAGTGYNTGTGIATSGYGNGLTVDITSITNGSIASSTLTNSGTRYSLGTNIATTGGGNNDATVDINSISNTTIGSSILLGSNTSTGGFSNSIAIGSFTQNSAESQLNIGNALFIDGIYSSQTTSSTPVSGAILSASYRGVKAQVANELNMLFVGDNIVSDKNEIVLLTV